MGPDRTKRRQIFEALTPGFGKMVSARFLRNPSLPGVDRIHPEALAWHREQRFGLFTRTRSIRPHPNA